jgi:pimeloyl-ACP methyl ester carboxylesterase/predicted amino acid-binding ACT domain protein
VGMSMAMPTRRAAGGLEWRNGEVQGRAASFAVGGQGLPVVFLHGWGLGHRAYERALRELVGRGCRVYAPALPGFGGTAYLPVRRRTLEGYAAWVDDFIESVGLDQPALVVGHSFGGGVAIRLTHDAPRRVRQLVLINSVGHPADAGGHRPLGQRSERPPWEYGVQFVRELFTREGYRTMLAMREDLLSNMVANPLALVEVGALARRADLTAELAELRRREVAVLVLWSDADGVLPLASFDALCAAIGTEGTVLPGGHSWLLANPRALSAVLENVLRVQAADHDSEGLRATTAELRNLLRHTNIPPRVVTRLLTAASPLWMMSEQVAVLAADLALCHPPLAPAEVRAVARPLEQPGTFRLTVVAADRPGLLADTAAALSDEGLTVLSASVTTWTGRAVALHSLTVTSTETARPASPDWDALGDALRSAARGHRPTSQYVPTGRATVSAADSGAGRTLVKVVAPDGLGLLQTITRWFAERGLSIEAAEITTRDGIATDRFLVDGAVEAVALGDHLSPGRRPPWPLAQLRGGCSLRPWRRSAGPHDAALTRRP